MNATRQSRAVWLFLLAAFLFAASTPSAHAIRANIASEKPTLSSETRVGVSGAEAPGRYLLVVAEKPDGTRVLVGCVYENASGLREWLNRDPIGESGGLNLYGFNRNNAIKYVDAYGEGPVDWLLTGSWDPSAASWAGWAEGYTGSGANAAAISMGETMGGGLAWLYDSIPFVGNSDLRPHETQQIADAQNNSVLGQTENAGPAAYYGTRACLGISAASTAVASAVLASEVAASQGLFNLSQHVSSQLSQRYWSEICVRNAISNGPRLSNFAGQNPLWNWLSTIKYPVGNNGEVVINWITRNIVHYLPK